jgi:hypothetical protein
MSVDIEPLELSFQRPFNVEVSQTLTIKNPNTTPVAFKVKTTAPKQYVITFFDRHANRHTLIRLSTDTASVQMPDESSLDKISM